MFLAIFRLGVCELFSVYIHVAQEKQGSQERVVHAVSFCLFFVRATGEWLGRDICAPAYSAQGKGGGMSGVGDGEEFAG